MTLKQFLSQFDLDRPDFSVAPADFPNSSLSGLTSAEVGKFLAAKTAWEIRRPPQPRERSRQSQTPNGCIHLVAWSNAGLLRILMTAWFRWYRVIHGYNKGFYRNLKDFTGPLTSSKSPLNSFTPAWLNLNHPGRVSPITSFRSPVNSFTPAWLNPKLLDRLEAQLLDALRSVIANIEEGYGRPTTMEYLNFLGYTQASLKEGKGDIHRMKQDGLLMSKPGSKLADIRIDLSAWHAALKKSVISRPAEDKGIYRTLQESKGATDPTSVSIPASPLIPYKSPLNSSKFGYPPVDNFDPAGNPSPLTSLKSPLNSSKFGYPPVDNFDPAKLTYEMLIELVNKTDWNLRQLVSSLESKLDADRKSYQIERARIRGKVNWRR